MQPELQIGPLELKTFGICFALGFVAAGLVGARRLRELDLPVDWAYEIIFAGLAGGFVGARVDYVIQNWDTASEDLVGAAFSGSGLVWLGGVVGGAIAVLAWARWRGFLGLALLDLTAPLIALGYAIGRVGCQLSGDGDYGKASDLPWAMAYPDGTEPIDTAVHPTPIYESIAMGLVALALWRLRDRLRPGLIFALWLVLTGLERLLVEFVRRNETAALSLTLAQLVSVAMIAAGAAWLVRARQPA
ncbi:MAG TPA: prolipoprotein diacylglyceryl transferase [Thermoleophilaceae bacterium]